MGKGNKLSLGLALFPFSRQEKEGRMENYVEHLVKGKIEVVSVETLGQDYRYSDHNPVRLKYKLK